MELETMNTKTDNVISDKVLIEIEESQNQDNNMPENNKIGDTEEAVVNKLPLDNKQGREVKPKKIPIGGIQMPGFFQRKSPQKPDFDSSKFETISLKNDKDSISVTNNSNTNSLNSRSFRSLNPIKVLPSIDSIKSFRLPFLKSTANDTPTNDRQLVKEKIIDLASVETLNDDSPPIVLNKLNVSSTSKEKLSTNGNKMPFRKRFLATITRLRPYRTPISAMIIFLLICISILILSKYNRKKPTPPIYNKNTVQTLTSCGIVEGLREDGSIGFRGIPYAVPPIGVRRWQKAQPLNLLKYCMNDTLIAYGHPNSDIKCLQLSANNSIDGDENCLTLDVITPHVRTEYLLPVIVMIGAETLNGPSPAKARPSARYARSRDVIFVRPNFRLGVLGFLSTDELTKKQRPLTSGNYGLSDLIEVLRWIQLNIQYFGGNRDQVTLMGYRSGATLALSLAFSEHSHLFKQVWAFSGAAWLRKISLEQAHNQNERLVYDHNCSSNNNVLNCLLDLDAEELMESTPDGWRKPTVYNLPAIQSKDEYQHHWLIQDGDILRNISTVNSKKLKIGTTAHAAYTEELENVYLEWNATQVRKYVNDSIIGFMNLTDEVFKYYRETFHGLLEIITDIRIACPLYDLKKRLKKDGYNVLFYIVKQTRYENKISDIDSDIDAILGRYEPKTTEQRRYFASIQQFFYYFVSRGLFQKPFDPNESLYQYFEIEQDVISIANYSRCDFWFLHNILPKYAQLE